jgi:hypothetical protein
MPLASNPAPEILTLEMVRLEFPALLIVTLRMRSPPRSTFPKLRRVALVASDPEETGAEFVPALVNPPQPESESVTRKMSRMDSNVSGAYRLGIGLLGS